MDERLKQRYVVAFDISDDRQRYRVNKILAHWGNRVQKSVYEILITRGELVELEQRLRQHLGEADSLRIYLPSSQQKGLFLGKNELIIDYPDTVVL